MSARTLVALSCKNILCSSSKYCFPLVARDGVVLFLGEPLLKFHLGLITGKKNSAGRGQQSNRVPCFGRSCILSKKGVPRLSLDAFKNLNREFEMRALEDGWT